MTRQGEKAARRRLPRGKLWLDVIMLLSLAVLAVALYLVTPDQTQLAPIFDDLELLAGSAEPAVYQELEFYYWLERHGQE